MTKELMVQTAFRLPDSLIRRIDAHAKRMDAANPGLSFTRVDAVRVLLTMALESVESSESPPRRKDK